MSPLQKQLILYQASYTFYQAGNYARAADLFLQLAREAPFEKEYWKGLASCQQMQGKYDDALHAWSLAALLCEEDPMPHFHAAECLLSQNNKEEALKALFLAEKKTGLSGQIRSKITLLKEACQ